MEVFLSIKEAVNKYILSCTRKMDMPIDKVLVRAFLAGMMIAMGAAGSSVAAHTIENVGLARMSAAVVFPMGLMMVIMTGAELFTGDCLMIMGTATKQYRVLSLIKVLFVVYIGNFIGAGLTALGVMYSGQLNYTDGLMGAYTIKVALGKTAMTGYEAVVSGILCNILVCLAVIMALCARDVAGKLLTSFFVIFLFVTAGFEHCVANMYYIPAGLLAKTNPQYVKVAMDAYGYTMEQLSQLNVHNFLIKNMLPVTIGNIIGGMVIIGLPLLYLNREKNREMRKAKREEALAK